MNKTKLSAILISVLLCTGGGVLLLDGQTLNAKIKYLDRQYTDLLPADIQVRKQIAEASLGKPHREAVSCPENYVGIVGFGQSNISNYIKRTELIRTVDADTYMYDWTNGKCYLMSEPLVGTENAGYGNVLTDIALDLRRRGVKDKLLIAPIAKGGSSVFEWAYGPYKHRLDYVLAQAQKNGLEFNIWLWQQGETDAVPEKLTAMKKEYAMSGLQDGQSYVTALETVLDIVNHAYPDAKFGVSLTSKCESPSSRLITSAQQEVIDKRPDVYFSVNTDSYGSDYRRDGCHFNEQGAKEIAAEYGSLIRRIIEN